MRVHANRDSALVLAAQASKAVPKITTIPELKGIHMEADARLAMLTMTATNQEVSIRASMPAAVEESGSAVIPADLLPDILKRLPGDQVSFSTVGPGIIHIGSGYAEYRLNILDAAKYPLPEVPFLEDTIPVSGICSLARQTLFAAAAGDQQNILTFSPRCVRQSKPQVERLRENGGKHLPWKFQASAAIAVGRSSSPRPAPSIPRGVSRSTYASTATPMSGAIRMADRWERWPTPFSA